jgi:hypothetical protein
VSAQTLEGFIVRYFPKHDVESRTGQEDRVDLDKLCAQFFMKEITIIWTPNLVDHLRLTVGVDTKTLEIFELACYAETSFMHRANGCDL